jgi:hypothetical protein
MGLSLGAGSTDFLVLLCDSDWRFVQELCLKLLNDRDSDVVATAILSLGHLARLHHELTLDRVRPALEGLKKGPRYSGRVDDTFDDIQTFIEKAP